ncbi:cytochrome c biogenesis protein ResB [Paenibacillus larvae]|uniref:cytochrome c biogenesis protein ResB n=1 Tax=Paenibacillus larvae TaxID=1464 RepID=UPI0002D7613D|nr:cytochrome c biogenesis protein ResB [Paenibacillus larvae]
MIQNTKCECGHQNPVGTVLCESCGKPTEEYEDSGGILEMRYDGAARRSQRKDRNVVIKVWSFFSSVRVAIYLIIITLIGAALGSIYPQEDSFLSIDPVTYYKDTYGWTGELYYKLGLSHTYQSWWFVTLLFMIGTSLVICSLDRVLPLYKALNKQQVRKHPSFISRQRISLEQELPAGISAEDWIRQMGQTLKKKHYRVNIDGTALLAEKNRFSRWGPYINHIGLIIFLLAVLMRGLPGWQMDQYIQIREGETKLIPNTSYYLKNEKFTVDFYDENELTQKMKDEGQTLPKSFETKAVLYKCTDRCDDPGQEPVLEQVTSHNIMVNHPLNYQGIKAYQYSYEMDPVLISVTPSLVNKQTGEQIGSFDLKMQNPEKQYKIGPYTLQLKAYFPEFGLDNKGQPVTKSNEPKAPAFIFQLNGPGITENGENFMYFPKQSDKIRFRQDDLNGELGKRFELSVDSMDKVHLSEFVSSLNIRMDRALPFIWVGAAISMIGLVMGFYWQHRRIWIRIDGRKLLLGAHINKNWYAIRKESASALSQNGIKLEDDKRLDRGGNRK